MIPVGGHMKVTQSYHFSANAGNEYQGDTLSFDITVKAEQLKNTVTMVHKTGSNWDTIDHSQAASAVLAYKMNNDTFNYDLAVNGLTASANYVVVSGTNPYNGPDTVQLVAFTTDGSGNYNVTGQVEDLNKDLTNAKVWVIPASDWTGPTGPMTGWNGANYLFEIALIDYVDPIH